MSMGMRFGRMGWMSRADRSLSCIPLILTIGCTSDAIDSQTIAYPPREEMSTSIPSPSVRGPEEVCWADIIAEVTIDELWDLRSRAPSGVVLTPEPTDFLSPAPATEEGQVWRPIVLSIDRLYKGEIDSSVSIVTAVVHDFQYHHVPALDPQVVVESKELQVGDQALVFLVSADPMVTHPVYDFIRAEAESRSSQGAATYVEDVRSWYRIEGSEALNIDVRWPDLGVAELRARVLECSGSGTTAAIESAVSSPDAEPTPYPTEQDLIAEARATAEAVAADDPELSDTSIIPTLTQMLQATDPYVRMMGASAVGRIATTGEANASGLREAVRNDSTLQAALFDTLGYEYNVGYDDKDARAETARAILFLYLDAPSGAVETQLTEQYWNETSRPVRFRIVEALGEHGYTSQATIDVLDDAKADSDEELAAMAQAFRDAIP